MTTSTQSNLLDQVARLALAKERDAAIAELRSLADSESSIEFHLWQAWLANSPAAGIQALRTVLELDPSHEAAEAGITWLTSLNSWEYGEIDSLCEAQTTECVTADADTTECELSDDVSEVEEVTLEVSPFEDIDTTDEDGNAVSNDESMTSDAAFDGEHMEESRSADEVSVIEPLSTDQDAASEETVCEENAREPQPATTDAGAFTDSESESDDSELSSPELAVCHATESSDADTDADCKDIDSDEALAHSDSNDDTTAVELEENPDQAECEPALETSASDVEIDDQQVTSAEDEEVLTQAVSDCEVSDSQINDELNEHDELVEANEDATTPIASGPEESEVTDHLDLEADADEDLQTAESTAELQIEQAADPAEEQDTEIEVCASSDTDSDSSHDSEPQNLEPENSDPQDAAETEEIVGQASDPIESELLEDVKSVQAVVESSSQASDEPASDEPASDAPAEQSPRAMILAVDDSPTVRKLVAMTLERVGFEVVCAADGVAALNLLAERRPVLILSDINMPRLSGYKLCKLIKKHPRTEDIPVVLLSGKNGVFDKVRGQMSGCSDYITKPFESHDLIEKVRKYARVPADETQAV